MALGLAGFALIVILGAMPLGLQTVREAQAQEVAANIARQLQASLQPISFAAASTGTNIDALAATTRFYTDNGIETAAPSQSNPDASSAYYQASFAVAEASFDDGSGSLAGPTTLLAADVRRVTLTLAYPQMGLTAGRNKFVYLFLVARQGSE